MTTKHSDDMIMVCSTASEKFSKITGYGSLAQECDTYAYHLLVKSTLLHHIVPIFSTGAFPILVHRPAHDQH